jgi:hypothetical protein
MLHRVPILVTFALYCFIRGRYNVYNLEISGEINGIIIFAHPPNIHISFVAFYVVDQYYRGRGLGRKMWNLMEKHTDPSRIRVLHSCEPQQSIASAIITNSLRKLTGPSRPGLSKKGPGTLSQKQGRNLKLFLVRPPPSAIVFSAAGKILSFFQYRTQTFCNISAPETEFQCIFGAASNIFDDFSASQANFLQF